MNALDNQERFYKKVIKARSIKEFIHLDCNFIPCCDCILSIKNNNYGTTCDTLKLKELKEICNNYFISKELKENIK